MTTRTVSTELTPAQRQAFEEAVERHGKSFFANADLIWKTLLGASDDGWAGKATPQMIHAGIDALNMPWDSVIPPGADRDEYILAMVWAAMQDAQSLPASPKPTDTAEKEVGDGSPSDA